MVFIFVLYTVLICICKMKVNSLILYLGQKYIKKKFKLSQHHNYAIIHKHYIILLISALKLYLASNNEDYE